MSDLVNKYRHPLSLKLCYPFLRLVVRGLFGWYRAKIRAHDRQNVPQEGSLLIFSNHISNTDPIVVQMACPRLVNFMARRPLFSMKVIGPLVKWFRAFPVTQSSADKEAIKTALALLEAEKAVVVFPEGQLSPDGNLIRILPGAALLAKRSGAGCICVGLKNSNKVMPYPETKLQKANCTITANWGELRSFTKDDDAQAILDWIASELRRLTV